MNNPLSQEFCALVPSESMINFTGQFTSFFYLTSPEFHLLTRNSEKNHKKSEIHQKTGSADENFCNGKWMER